MVREQIIEARARFMAVVTIALQPLQPRLATLFAAPGARLELIDPATVEAIVQGWPRHERGLNWKAALSKCRNRSKCAFIGLTAAGATQILFFVRVSRGNVHTTMLYAEKSLNFHTSKGAATELADWVLRAIGLAFQSKYVVLDRPVEGLIDHYSERGFQVARRSGPRVRTMLKPV